MNNKSKFAVLLMTACMMCFTACNNTQWGASIANQTWETTAETSLEDTYVTSPSMKRAKTILEETKSDGTKFLIRDLKGVAYVEITFNSDDAQTNTTALVNSILIRSDVLKEYDDVSFYWYDTNGVVAVSVIERDESGYDTSPTYGIMWYQEDYYNAYMQIDPTK